MAWYDSNWSYRIPVTIDSTKVSADLTDFPVYVDLSDLGTDFFSNVKTDGSDIRVTKDDGTTEVPREVVAIDTGSSTGELHFKADGTLSSSTDTDFYIYYGNASATEPATSATYGRNNVWDSNYKGVFHLQQDPSGTAPQIINSKGSGIGDGTSQGSMTSGDLVDSKVGKGLDFDGINDYIDCPNLSTAFTSLNEFSISTVAKRTVMSGFDAWASNKQTGSNANCFVLNNYSSGQIDFLIGNSGGSLKYSKTSSAVITANTDHHLAVSVKTDNTSYAKIIYNGVDQALTGSTNSSIGTYTLSAANLFIGAERANSRYWQGHISEMRLSSSQRSVDWYTTESNNLLAPSTFYSAGAQETYTPSATFIPKITSVL